ncbi:MAG TPA: TetR/AcrR family transcriptional regulator [Candidatus Limnocylindria bacterium]|nr:TetR/AcrR family transcriptional regulator [Candidatus Limnocylindria bacterium]
MPATGRPRTEGTDAAVLAAAMQLLAERGYDGLTMEGVAARAGVAKTTVYRRWPSRAELVLEVANQIAAPVRLTPTGDLRRDLVSALRDIIGVLDAPIARRIIPRILADARESDELTAVLTAFWTNRRGRLRELLAAGVEAGEIRPDLDLEVAADALYGPVWYRYLVTRAPLTASAAEAIVDRAMEGMRP